MVGSSDKYLLNEQAETIERLRSKLQWAADRAVLALRGDADESETLSDINNTLRAALKS